jgi:type I restriction enzyme R subunit
VALFPKFIAYVPNVPRSGFNPVLGATGWNILGQIKAKGKSNTTQSRKFSELLGEAIKRYQSGLIDSATVIQELAQKIKEEEERGEKMGMGEDELAFYDALAANNGAQVIMGDEVLKAIARELVDSVRRIHL